MRDVEFSGLCVETVLKYREVFKSVIFGFVMILAIKILYYNL